MMRCRIAALLSLRPIRLARPSITAASAAMRRSALRVFWDFLWTQSGRSRTVARRRSIRRRFIGQDPDPNVRFQLRATRTGYGPLLNAR